MPDTAVRRNTRDREDAENAQEKTQTNLSGKKRETRMER